MTVILIDKIELKAPCPVTFKVRKLTSLGFIEMFQQYWEDCRCFDSLRINFNEFCFTVSKI